MSRKTTSLGCCGDWPSLWSIRTNNMSMQLGSSGSMIRGVWTDGGHDFLTWSYILDPPPNTTSKLTVGIKGIE